MEYLDGELPADERALLEQHLADCEECRLELDAQKRVMDCVKTLEQVPAPPSLARDVQAQIARVNAPPAIWGRLLRRYGAMAASIAIVIGGYAIIAKQHKPPASERPAANSPAPSREQDLAMALHDEAKAESAAEMPAMVREEAAPYARSKASDAKLAASSAPAGSTRAAEAEMAPADVVIRADDQNRCAGELEAFLAERGYAVVGKAQAERTVILAQVNLQDEGGAADAGNIVAELAKSGKFSIVAPALGFDGKTVAAARKEAPAAMADAVVPRVAQAVAEKADAELGTALAAETRQICIMIVSTRDAETMRKPPAGTSGKNPIEQAEPAGEK